ncbi:MAG: biotin-dependent carboxyltransferase family protein, partial [Candidatus Methylomirabilaceae bacterium]
MHGVEVVRPGLLTTVQDLGRLGFQRYGVPASGAMDQVSLRTANLLVGNEDGAAGLEATGDGPTLRALADLVVAVVGADMQPLVDGRPIESGAAVPIKRGQLLELGRARWGLRAYVTIAGGIDVPVVLGSRSTCLPAAFGGFQGRPLREGDLLPVGAAEGRTAARQNRSLPPGWLGPLAETLTLRVVLGPQNDLFTSEGVGTFLNGAYRLMPEMDRMGARLQGPAIAHRASADIISDSIPLGAVQIPADGQPIILLADRQTTGGYAKIAVVVSEDVFRLAQATPGQVIRFREISLAEAYAGVRAYEARFLV